jgi:hypothetical protein
LDYALELLPSAPTSPASSLLPPPLQLQSHFHFPLLATMLVRCLMMPTPRGNGPAYEALAMASHRWCPRSLFSPTSPWLLLASGQAGWHVAIRAPCRVSIATQNSHSIVIFSRRSWALRGG